LAPARAGIIFGMSVMVLGSLGVLAGGRISDALRRRGYLDANLRIGLIAAAAMLIAGVAAPLAPSPIIAAGIYAIFIFFSSFPFGGAATAFQEVTPNQMRAQVSAAYFFVLNLAGIGIGPTLVAAITQGLFHDDLALRYALAIVAAVLTPLAALILWGGCKPYRYLLSQIQTAPVMVSL
jgi:MFS family permease